MYFKQSTHQYIINDKPYTSFSSIIKLVEPEKDWDDIAAKYAKKHSTKKEPLTAEQVKKKWAEEGRVAREKGTLFHSLKEEEDKSSKDKPVFFTEFDGDIKPIKSLEELEDGIHPELCLYNNEFQACGMTDRCFIETIDGVRYIDLEDFKGLDINTPIPTIDGFKLMKDIEVGDIIFDGEGNTTKVMHVSNIHYNPCYKITFDSGESIICDHEHKWELTFKKHDGKKYYPINMIYDTEYIFNNFKNLKNKKCPKIKCTSLKIDKDIDLPLDPYVLGLWLGDGDKSSGRLTCMNQDIWEEIIKRGYSLSEDHTRNDFRTKAESRTIYGIHTELRKLNLLFNKHIPDIYMRSSFNQRLDLLRGFMDSDGYYNRKRNRCVMATTKKWQAEALSSLINSLGYKSTIIEALTTGFGKINIPRFDVCFTPIDNPFLVRNKDFKPFIGKGFEVSKFRQIKKIEKVDTIPTKCLAVESPLHTYLFGYSYIKTHNTSKNIDLESFYDTRNQKYATLNAPLNHIMDCNFMKYSLQLSMYAFFLEKYNFTPRNLTINHLVIKKWEDEPPITEPKYNINFENSKYYVADEILYPVKYMKKEVKALLQYHKSKQRR